MLSQMPHAIVTFKFIVRERKLITELNGGAEKYTFFQILDIEICQHFENSKIFSTLNFYIFWLTKTFGHLAIMTPGIILAL